MKEVFRNLYIGNDADCAACAKNSDFAIVHACKTCHQKALRYTKSLPQTHPNYLVYENGNHLFLNLVDMPNEFSPKFTHPIFLAAICFIGKNIADKKVLIHCNQGQSRSTSIGLVYLAIAGVISKDTYQNAVKDFINIYPEYIPGNGAMLYTKNNWNYLVN